MRWPSFVNLFGAWFFLALIPLIILYFLKLRRPKMEVPSLVLWQSVVNDQRVNSPFQKFRRNLLLLLHVHFQQRFVFGSTLLDDRQVLGPRQPLHFFIGLPRGLLGRLLREAMPFADQGQTWQFLFVVFAFALMVSVL